MNDIEATGWAILFDLDQTLILTSAIEHLRRKRAWQQVYCSFSETKLPPGTREFVKGIQRYGTLGVVTTSPRPYAERLLAYHGLQIPVIIAYYDVSRRKPHPEPILMAAKRLQIPPHKCVYIGDLVEDIQSAVRAGAISIGITWDSSLCKQPEAELARGVCKNWDEVLKAIESTVSSNRS